MAKLVHGIGINDADYPITKNAIVDEKKVQIWICPFYSIWKSLLQRCYDKKVLLKYPTYQYCSVVPEWHYFMTFRAWMEKQDWQRKHLDKDILFPGNKIYGPDTCVFIDPNVNTFIIEKTKSRELPIGVKLNKQMGKYEARCRDVVKFEQKYLGLFDTPEEAHQAWLSYKLKQAYILAEQQSDPRVASALISRYENYAPL